MKLLHSFLKDLRLAYRTYYVYMELGIALLVVAVLIFVMPENFNRSAKAWLHVADASLPAAAIEKALGEDGLDIGRVATGAELRERLEEACRQGGTTLFTSGFDPGWSGDVIPLSLASVCERVDSIRVSELMDYSTYEDPGFTGVYFGFGRPLDFAAPLLQPGMLKGGW
ncbi:MAG TPA: hypothetical protein PKW82_06955, partial [Spirochaetales bacterium]|nr:hypothetical protein [Spirochaetales bacterium]